MQNPTYRKGPYTATVLTEAFDDGTFQGMVALSREGNPSVPDTYRVEARSLSQNEAFEEAHALAHRLLADLGENGAS